MTGGRLPCWWYDVLFPGHQRTVKTSTRIAETTGAGSTGAGLEVTAFVGSLSPGDGISVKRDARVIASLPGVCQLGVGFLHEVETKGIMSGFFPQLCVLERVRVFTRDLEETQDLGTDEPNDSRSARLAAGGQLYPWPCRAHDYTAWKRCLYYHRLRSRFIP